MYALGLNFEILSFDILYDHLNREQSKLVKLYFISKSKNQVLVAQTLKGKHKT
jgi:hypothetical protein